MTAQTVSIATEAGGVVQPPRKLRFWPATLILALQVATILVSVTPSINNTVRFGFMMLGPLGCLLLFGLWFLLLSRLHWIEKLVIPLLTAGGALVAIRLMHPSMGVAFWIYAVPLAMAATVLGLRFSQHLVGPRRAAVALGLVTLVWAVVPALRLEGFGGDYSPELAWRWSATREQQLLSTTTAPVSAEMKSTVVLGEPQPDDWPRFRGAGLDSRAVGSFGELDWRERRPKIAWKQPIGPGWSSFSGVAGRLFTQEQRGESEVVSCLDAATGRVLWQDEAQTRFSDVVAGAGPRATPTYHGGRLYTYGAKAILSALDAATGKLLWRRDLMREVGARLPVWGFANSPIVVGKVVIVYAGGDGENGLVAHDLQTGEPVWHRSQSGMNFGTVQPVSLPGGDLVLFSSPTGLEALDPATGELVWQFTPQNWHGPIMCQPQRIGASGLVVSLGDGVGVARLEVEHKDNGWQVREAWTSTYLKPSFNDFVYVDGFLYGFDQNIFACVDATTGRRAWKQGRYGFGQVLALPESERLIVTTEQGEVVLLATDPREHRELGRFPVIEGKTWNHPALVRGLLLVRNGSEAAALMLGPGPDPKPAESAPAN